MCGPKWLLGSNKRGFLIYHIYHSLSLKLKLVSNDTADVTGGKPIAVLLQFMRNIVNCFVVIINMIILV
jgi:hypothetical protein